MTRLALVLTLVTTLAGCALSRRATIGELAHHPGRYYDKTVTVVGVVTSAWGLPLAPYSFYRVDDGTGQLTVLSQGRLAPTRGARVRVRGRVEQVAVLGGRSLGLHMRASDLDVLRR